MLPIFLKMFAEVFLQMGQQDACNVMIQKELLVDFVWAHHWYVIEDPESFAKNFDPHSAIFCPITYRILANRLVNDTD